MSPAEAAEVARKAVKIASISLDCNLLIYFALLNCTDIDVLAQGHLMYAIL